MNAPGATHAVPNDAPSAHELARRLIARAAKMSGTSVGGAPAAFAACQVTYRALARSMGTPSASALLSRALAMADDAQPLLREIPFDREDDLGILAVHAAAEKYGSSATGVAVEKLLELLLALLERFVGIDVVVRLVAQTATIGTKEDEDTQ